MKMTTRQQLRFLLVWQVVASVLGGVAVTLGFGSDAGASFAIGSVLMTLNVVALAWLWWRIFGQKTIAWTVLIIVIKYAILFASIFYLSRLSWFSTLSAGLGLVTFILPALILAAQTIDNQKA
jgi:hypothetical protein